MISETDKTLVQAGVDGELGREGRARLERLLADSEEARALHDELQALSETLRNVPSQEPPADLHGRIVDGITLPRGSRFAEWFDFSALPGVLRYGLAAGIAVVLTVAVYRGGSDIEPPADYADMVGTLARGGPVAEGRELDRFRFEEPGATGQVRLLERDGIYALEFELKSGESLQFDVDFSDNGLVFDAFAQQERPLEAVSWGDGSLSAQAQGEQTFVILMRREGDALPAVDVIPVTVSRGGLPLAEGALNAGD